MEIEKAAIAYFNAASHEVRESTVQCLQKGEEDLKFLTVGRFRNILKDRGGFDIPDSLLKELNLDPKDPLGFKEFLVMSYAAKTQKHSCENCNAFLTGIYFTCVVCFEEEDKTYNLCTACFGKKRTCSLNHAAFRDNFTLLQSKSNQAKLIAHQNNKESSSMTSKSTELTAFTGTSTQDTQTCETNFLIAIDELGNQYTEHEFTHPKFEKGRTLFWEKVHLKAEVECSIM